MWPQKRLNSFSHQAVRGIHRSAAVLAGALLHSALLFVSYFLGLTSAGSISQAPEWTAFHLNWLMDSTHGWLEGRRGGSNWAIFLFFVFFLSLFAFKHFSGSGCCFLSFPAPSGQACHLFSHCYLTLTFAIW